MLSIRFDSTHEWWAPGRVVERLFKSGLEAQHLAPTLEEWQHVADANGGLSFDDLDPEIARELRAGLRAAAAAELTRFAEVDLQTEDGTYKTSLERLLDVTAESPS